MNEIQQLNLHALLRSRFTPDIALLDCKQFHNVFICDDLQRAGVNHKLLSPHSVCNPVRVFTEKKYQFYQWRTDGRGVPIFPREQPKGRYDFSALRIKGELHTVTTDGLLALDPHYENGVQFKRLRINVLFPVTPHGEIVNRDTMGRELPKALQGHKHFLLPERVDPIEVWMYQAKYSYWGPLLDGGFAFEPVPILEPKKERNWLPKFYQYPNRV